MRLVRLVVLLAGGAHGVSYDSFLVSLWAQTDGNTDGELGRTELADALLLLDISSELLRDETLLDITHMWRMFDQSSVDARHILVCESFYFDCRSNRDSNSQSDVHLTLWSGDIHSHDSVSQLLSFSRRSSSDLLASRLRALCRKVKPKITDFSDKEEPACL